MKTARAIKPSLIVLTFALLLVQTGRGDEKLTEAIGRFARDEPGSIGLGMFEVVDSDSVATVLSYKERAIPDLKQALKSSNPLIVAQAAWCLDCLKAKDATSDVWNAYHRFAAVPKPRKREEEYAVERTAVLLSRYASIKNINSLL